jgi:hypothetical protein
MLAKLIIRLAPASTLASLRATLNAGSNLRPSYAHHIHGYSDVATGETFKQSVHVTARDRNGRIRCTQVLTSKER